MEAKRELDGRNGMIVAPSKARMMNQTLEEMGSRPDFPRPGKEEHLTDKLMNTVHDRKRSWPRKKAMLLPDHWRLGAGQEKQGQTLTERRSNPPMLKNSERASVCLQVTRDQTRATLL